MKALVCSDFGSTQDLTLEQREDLEPGAGEVLIGVKAAGVNFPDILTVEGKYQFKPELPFIPGTEVSGVVTKLGKVLLLVRWGMKWSVWCKLVALPARLLPLNIRLSRKVAACHMSRRRVLL